MALKTNLEISDFWHRDDRFDRLCVYVSGLDPMNVLRFPDAPVKRVKKLVLIARSLFLVKGLAAC
jgi:hypothetical protein